MTQISDLDPSVLICSIFFDPAIRFNDSIIPTIICSVAHEPEPRIQQPGHIVPRQCCLQAVVTRVIWASMHFCMLIWFYRSQFDGQPNKSNGMANMGRLSRSSSPSKEHDGSLGGMVRLKTVDIPHASDVWSARSQSSFWAVSTHKVPINHFFYTVICSVSVIRLFSLVIRK